MTNRKSYMRFRLVQKWLTLDDLEWPWTAKTQSVAEKMRLLEPTVQMWMKIDPYYQRQKCRPMNLVSGNVRFVGDIRGGSPGRERQMTVGLSTTAIFGDLCGYFFGNVRAKSSSITWRYATSYPLSACNWLQNEWPRMTLSANFTSKSVFEQQGCRALTFALARLSCFISDRYTTAAKIKSISTNVSVCLYMI